MFSKSRYFVKFLLQQIVELIFKNLTFSSRVYYVEYKTDSIVAIKGNENKMKLKLVKINDPSVSQKLCNILVHARLPRVHIT